MLTPLLGNLMRSMEFFLFNHFWGQPNLGLSTFLDLILCKGIRETFTLLDNSTQFLKGIDRI